MPPAQSDRSPDEARESLDRHIRKTVAVSALRKIRGLVDDYEEEQRSHERLSRHVVIAVTLIALAVAIALAVTGVSLFRLITGLIT